MTINVEKKERKVKFKKLSVGEPFKCSNDYYIKGYRSNADNNRVEYGVNLETGLVQTFYEDEPVELLESVEINIKE